MIRPPRMWSLALALLAGPGAALAAIGTDAAQELTRKSGLWVQLDSLGSQVREGMSDALDKNGARVSAAQRARMLDCAQSAFSADGLRETGVDAVAGALDPSDVAPLRDWYDSALGRKIASAEEASANQILAPQERLRRGRRVPLRGHGGLLRPLRRDRGRGHGGLHLLSSRGDGHSRGSSQLAYLLPHLGAHDGTLSFCPCTGG